MERRPRIRKRDRISNKARQLAGHVRSWFFNSLTEASNNNNNDASMFEELGFQNDSLEFAINSLLNSQSSTLCFLGDWSDPSFFRVLNEKMLAPSLSWKSGGSDVASDDWVIMATTDTVWEEGAIDRCVLMPQSWMDVSQNDDDQVIPMAGLDSLATTLSLRFRKDFVPTVIFSFPTEGQLRSALWSYALTLRSQVVPDNQEQRFAGMRDFWARVYEGTHFTVQLCSSEDDIAIPVRLLSYLGKTIAFKGLGLDTVHDMAFVKTNLLQVVQDVGFLATKCVLKLPSSKLESVEVIICDFSSSCNQYRKMRGSAALSSATMVVAVSQLVTASLAAMFARAKDFLGRLRLPAGQNPLTVISENDKAFFEQLSVLIGRPAGDVDVVSEQSDWPTRVLERFGNIRIARVSNKLQQIHKAWATMHVRMGESSSLVSKKAAELSDICSSQVVKPWKKNLFNCFKVVEERLGTLQMACYKEALLRWPIFQQQTVCKNLVRNAQPLCDLCCSLLIQNGPTLLDVSGVSSASQVMDRILQLCQEFFTFKFLSKNVNQLGEQVVQRMQVFSNVKMRSLSMKRDSLLADLETKRARLVADACKASVEEQIRLLHLNSFESEQQCVNGIHESLWEICSTAASSVRDSLAAFVISVIQQMSAVELDVSACAGALGNEEDAQMGGTMNDFVLQNVATIPLDSSSASVFSCQLVLSSEPSPAFLDRCRQLRLKCVAVGNGSQFEVISRQIYGSDEMSLLVRVLVASEVISGASGYQQMYRSVHGEILSVHPYVYGIATGGAGDAVALQAASNCFEAEFWVLSSQHPSIIVARPASGVVRRRCLMAHVGGNIFYALDKDSDNGMDDEDDDELQMKRRRPAHSESLVSFPKSPQVLPLKQLCLRVVLANPPAENVIIPSDVFDLLLVKMLRYCQVKTHILRPFLGPSILNFDLSHSHQVNDSVMQLIAESCPNLRKMCIQECALVTSVGLTALSGSRYLQELNISGCGRITDAGLSHVARGCPELRVLLANQMLDIRDGGIQNLLLSCQALERLELVRCRNLTPDAFRFLSQPCPLKHVDLTGCLISSDASLELLCRSARLERLLIGGNMTNDISDKCLQSLAFYCSDTLIELRISSAACISSAGVVDVMNKCSNLKILSVLQCPLVTHFPPQHGSPLQLDYVALTGELVTNSDALCCISPSTRYAEIAGSSLLTDQCLTPLAGPCLMHLDVSHTSVSDFGGKLIFESCPNLKAFCAAFTSITDAFLPDCSRIPPVDVLDLSGCDLTDRCGVQRVTTVRTLRLRECAGLTDGGIDVIVRSLPLITTLDLSFCALLGDGAVSSIGEHLLSIECLRMNFCPRISFAALVPFLDRMHLLSELHVCGVNLTGHIAPFTNASVRSLSIGWSVLDDRRLLELAKSFTYLSQLDLSWCNLITADALKGMCALNKNLFRLKLNGIKEVDALCANFLTRVCGMLVYM